METPLYLWAIGGLLILSAFFSGSETAFFSLSNLYLKKLKNSRDTSSRRVYRLMHRPHRLLTTILLGNTLVNIAASAIATMLTLALAHAWNLSELGQSLLLLAQMVVVTLLLLIVGEITPKLFAYSHSQRYASFAGFYLEVIKYLLYPVVIVLEGLSNLVSHSGREGSREELTGEEIHDLILYSDRLHDLEKNEQQLIDGIFRFPTLKAGQIMSPRVDMIAADVTSSMEDIRQLIVSSGHSRIPVFRGSVDNILGVIYAKDIILKKASHLRDMLRKPIFVPETMNVTDLLNNFRNHKVHLAIVVDEYGGTAGLITLEDVMEVLVGDIRDEYDHETPLIQPQGDNCWLVMATVGVNELNQKFDLTLDESYENLAELLFDEFNHLPAPGETVTLDRAGFTVKQLDGARLVSVLLCLEEDNAAED